MRNSSRNTKGNVNPQELLLKRVCGSFRKKGAWPRYRELELEFMKHESLEHVMAGLEPNTLRSMGGGDREEIQFTSPEAYATMCKGSDDLSRLAETAAFLGKLKLAGAERVTAAQIGNALGIKGVRLWRVIRLLEQDNNHLTSGGTRGETVESWEYGLADYAVYFADVTTYEELKSVRKRVDEIDVLRRTRDRPFSWINSSSERPHLPPISLPGIERLDYELHPAIAHVASTLLRSGHTNEAVRNAAARLESLLQDTLNDFHTPAAGLIGAALGGKEPRIRLNSLNTASDENEQKGFMYLAMGTMAAFRNVLSHGTTEQMSMHDAIERLVVISLIFGRLESAPSLKEVAPAAVT
jgi:uncharacterized protein (TIGR02391 family)